MTAGQKKEENLVDVKVIDRIKHEYLQHVEQKMSLCKGVDDNRLNSQQIREKKELNEKRTLGVKGFQAKTTYEMGLDPHDLKE